MNVFILTTYYTGCMLAIYRAGIEIGEPQGQGSPCITAGSSNINELLSQV